MNISLAYTVHTAAIEPVPVEAEVDGQKVTASVDRLVVELVADAGDHGHTFRLPVASSEDLAAQRAAFVTGRAVILTLVSGDAA